MNSCMLCILLLQVIGHSFAFTLHGGNETDKLSLLAFRAQITDDPFGALNSWNESFHFCEWSGVTCGRRHQRVVELDLHSYKLVGGLSPSIGNLSFLRLLNLENNSLSSSIPGELGRLFRLQMLRLGNNSFSGEIPANISSCANLIALRLEGNNLTEYGVGSDVSTYGDVYSFGILLLEMFTGKRPTDDMFKDGLNLHNYAEMALPGRVSEVVEPTLLREDVESSIHSSHRMNHTETGKTLECLISIIKIGVACSVELPRERMDIGSVVAELHRVRDILSGTRIRGQHEYVSVREGA